VAEGADGLRGEPEGHEQAGGGERAADGGQRPARAWRARWNRSSAVDSGWPSGVNSCQRGVRSGPVASRTPKMF
jgi:hypothetical protein